MHAHLPEPVGLQVIGAAQLLSRALDDALTAAGGSLAMWLVLVSASGKDRQHRSRPEVSDARGDEEPTGTNLLHRMEIAGLIIRKPDAQIPRRQAVELTEAGKGLFHRLLRAVVAFAKQLRTGLTSHDIDTLTSTLNRLRSNIPDEETSCRSPSSFATDHASFMNILWTSSMS